MLQCRKGLCLAFLRHGSSVDRSSGVLGGPLQGVDGLALQPDWLLSSSVGTVRTQEPRRPTAQSPGTTLMLSHPGPFLLSQGLRK